MIEKKYAAVSVAATAAITMLKTHGFDLWGAHIVPAISLVAAVAGSYLPDLCTHRSVIEKRPRGFTHAPVIPLFFLIIMRVVTYFVGTAFINTLLCSLLFGLSLGWLSHVFADFFIRKSRPTTLEEYFTERSANAHACVYAYYKHLITHEARKG